MSNKVAKLEAKISTWWKVKQKQWSIVKENGTVWHYLAWFIHTTAKVIGLLVLPYSLLRTKVYPQPIKIDKNLKAELKQKFELYSKLIKTHQDQHGFILSHECDSLLYSSLIACFLPVDITSAKDEKGWWHRRPLTLPKCWDGVGKSNGSGSTISRDMFTGLLWAFYFKFDRESAEDLYEHARKHQFVMGKGDPARLVLMPKLEAILCEIIYALGGKNHWLARNQYHLWSTKLDHYGLHLLILSGLLWGLVKGHITSDLLKAYEIYAKKNPDNPLYQLAYRLYTDGDMNPVANLLLDEKYWPKNRLPTSADRKFEWLPARDSYTDAYLPAQSTTATEHSGGDFLFVAGLLEILQQ